MERLRPRTDWFRQGKWGIFLHYLAETIFKDRPGELTSREWNHCVDGFQVERLTTQLAELNVGHCILTLGQNSGYFCSPNQTYDSLVCRAESHLSQRDLVRDLAESLSSHQIHLLVYLPSHAPACDRLAVESLHCTPTWDASLWKLFPGTYTVSQDTDLRLSRFQKHWEVIVSEWSIRWGKQVRGWWFDGCYYADVMYRNPDEPNFESFARSARIGNKTSIVAFNSGVHSVLEPLTPYEDFLAGETKDFFPVAYRTRDQGVQSLRWNVEGSQLHLLTYLGENWGTGLPRFPEDFLTSYTKFFSDHGGVLTFDIPIAVDGTISDSYMTHLSALSRIRSLP